MWQPNSVTLSSNRLGVKLKLCGSRRLLWWTLVVGVLLFIAASVLQWKYEDEVLVEGIRWLFMLSACGMSIFMSVIVVELFAPQIEVRFFQALMAMPSSWALYKCFIWSACLYFSWQSLWHWSDLGVSPEEPMQSDTSNGCLVFNKPQVARVVQKFVYVFVLFMTVTLVLVVISKVVVSYLYSRNHSHKVLSALQQESILADLAACVAPVRKTEQLPPELERSNSHEDTVAPLPTSDARNIFNEGGRDHMAHMRLSRNNRQASSRIVLPDGLSGSVDPVAPGLGLPKLRQTLSTVNSVGLKSMPSGLGLPRRYNPDNGSTFRHRTRTCTQVGVDVGASQDGSALNEHSLKGPLPSSGVAGNSIPISATATDMGATSVHGNSLSSVGMLQSYMMSRPDSLELSPRVITPGSRYLGHMTSSNLRSPGAEGPPSVRLGLPQAMQRVPPTSRIQRSRDGSMELGSTMRPVAESLLPYPPTSAARAASSPLPSPATGETATDVARLGSDLEPATANALANGGASSFLKEVSENASFTVPTKPNQGRKLTTPDRVSMSFNAMFSFGVRGSRKNGEQDSPGCVPFFKSPSAWKQHPAINEDDSSEADGTPSTISMGGKKQPKTSARGNAFSCLCFLPSCLVAMFKHIGSYISQRLAKSWLQFRKLRRAVVMQDAKTVHIRRTLVQALYLQYKLSTASDDKSRNEAAAAAALRAAHNHVGPWGVEGDEECEIKPPVRNIQSAPAMMQQGHQQGHQHSGPIMDDAFKGGVASFHDHTIPPPAWLRLTSPRRLLDELLSTYRSLTDGELSQMASTYAKLVMASVCPAHSEYITRQDLLDINIDPEGVEMVWDLFDKDHDDQITIQDLQATAVSFYQQRRNLALTVHAMRNLTLSLQIAVVLVVNGIFLMVVYLAILDVTSIFGVGKTSLDFFSAYIVVVSLLFGEMIRNLLGGALLLLAQQPFDIGEEIIIEEQPSWRYMGIIQDFNLLFLRMKKSTDGELVTVPLSKVFQNKFTNLTRSDWKFDQLYFTVDINTPHTILQELTDAAMAHIMAHPSEYDTEYGFSAFWSGVDKPNKLVIRTIYRMRFNWSAPHKRIGRARDGILAAIVKTFLEKNVTFVELRSCVHTVVPPEPPVPALSPTTDDPQPPDAPDASQLLPVVPADITIPDAPAGSLRAPIPSLPPAIAQQVLPRLFPHQHQPQTVAQAPPMPVQQAVQHPHYAAPTTVAYAYVPGCVAPIPVLIPAAALPLMQGVPPSTTPVGGSGTATPSAMPVPQALGMPTVPASAPVSIPIRVPAAPRSTPVAGSPAGGTPKAAASSPLRAGLPPRPPLHALQPPAEQSPPSSASHHAQSLLTQAATVVAANSNASGNVAGGIAASSSMSSLPAPVIPPAPALDSGAIPPASPYSVAVQQLLAGWAAYGVLPTDSSLTSQPDIPKQDQKPRGQL